MNSKVVLFGEADYGKTTVIGYLYSITQNIDMDKYEREVSEKMGSRYKPDYLYPSLLDKNIPESGRINTIKHTIKNINGANIGSNENFTVIDTPGHQKYLPEREIGISLADIGVCCFAINEVLKNRFPNTLSEFSTLWFQFHKNKKMIYLLTKFDLLNYSENEYNKACFMINKFCKRIIAEYSDTVFGVDIITDIEEKDVAAIIPVAVDFRNKIGHNIVVRSGDTPWYKGPTLSEAVMRSVRNEI